VKLSDQAAAAQRAGLLRNSKAISLSSRDLQSPGDSVRGADHSIDVWRRAVRRRQADFSDANPDREPPDKIDFFKDEDVVFGTPLWTMAGGGGGGAEWARWPSGRERNSDADPVYGRQYMHGSCRGR